MGTQKEIRRENGTRESYSTMPKCPVSRERQVDQAEASHRHAQDKG